MAETAQDRSGDPRWGAFRWAAVNKSKTAHIWLGQNTACGRFPAAHTLHHSLPDAECAACTAYMHGWLNRHDNGMAAARGLPNPIVTVNDLLAREAGRG